jgi:hypothetical protein
MFAYILGLFMGSIKSFMKTEGAKYETTESTEEFLGKS